MVVKYERPIDWIEYDASEIVSELAEAKAAVLALITVPYQRSWAEKLQAMELKREVAGTSRIEGAEFTENELDAALRDETPEEFLNRSQRQARAAKYTYRWISALPDDHPVHRELILEIHRRIVTGCDDDHCEPGVIRQADQNVIFGQPRHRGARGGEDCNQAFDDLCDAVSGAFRKHDLLIQGLAIHYHIGAMHPFQDGNGRTARALEALMLQRAGLKDDLFIAMSNYYYEEKSSYLQVLADVREAKFDLTDFLRFGLKGVARQCSQLLAEIRHELSKSLFRDVMGQMYSRLMSTRKRALATRQCAILEKLLEGNEAVDWRDLYRSLVTSYAALKAPGKAYTKDLNYLIRLKAITAQKIDDTFQISLRLDWATEVTETAFYAEMERMPAAKTHILPSP